MKNAQRTVAASSIALIMALSAQAAYATGVTAGTLIQNTASATYTSGAASGSVQSNTVTVRVDELLDVAVSGLAGSPVPAGAGTVVLPYSITNTGNGSEAFNVVANPAVSGNSFDAVVQSIAVDTNGNGVYDPGIDQILATGAPTPSIAADTSLTVFVLVTLPSGAADTNTSQVRLTATSTTGSGTPGTVITGAGSGGGDAVVGTSTASDDGLDSLIATLASVSLVKTATIADPFGGTQPVPGAVVTYSLVANVTGTGSVGSLHVIDIIPTGTTYQVGTLKLQGSALTDAADADAGTASAAGVDVNVGSVTGGATKTVTFQVKIN